MRVLIWCYLVSVDDLLPQSLTYTQVRSSLPVSWWGIFLSKGTRRDLWIQKPSLFSLIYSDNWLHAICRVESLHLIKTLKTLHAFIWQGCISKIEISQHWAFASHPIQGPAAGSIWQEYFQNNQTVELLSRVFLQRLQDYHFQILNCNVYILRAEAARHWIRLPALRWH